MEGPLTVWTHELTSRSMRAKMVRPVALRLTLPEAKLLDAWVSMRERTSPTSASDVLRLALVASGMSAVGRDEWMKIAREGRVVEEWEERVASIGPAASLRELDARIATAPGDDDDRDTLRAQLRQAIEEIIAEHTSAHTCLSCGSALTGKDLAKARTCPQCGSPASSTREEDVPF
jgi:predicted RNA-binding Zn-ribbon protein involved in translation (DUF1610 family)